MHSMGSVHISRHNRKALAVQKGKKANSSGLTADFTLKEADTVFGRPSEWSSPVTDIETGVHSSCGGLQHPLMSTYFTGIAAWEARQHRPAHLLDMLPRADSSAAVCKCHWASHRCCTLCLSLQHLK